MFDSRPKDEVFMEKGNILGIKADETFSLYFKYEGNEGDSTPWN